METWAWSGDGTLWTRSSFLLPEKLGFITFPPIFSDSRETEQRAVGEDEGSFHVIWMNRHQVLPKSLVPAVSSREGPEPPLPVEGIQACCWGLLHSEEMPRLPLGSHCCLLLSLLCCSFHRLTPYFFILVIWLTQALPQHAESSSLTRDRTWEPYIGSLSHQTI